MAWNSSGSIGVLIAGGHGQGSALNQLNNPMGIYLDQVNSSIIYIADTNNNRIIMWVIGESNGTIVAGGNGVGSALNQLNSPRNVISDTLGYLYISDTSNHRIIQWYIGASSGTVIAGISGVAGSGVLQLNYPNGLTFDSQKNLYVADSTNFRAQKYLVCT
jgi:sugar lactone lactonase YvrE